jgi:hypothetical protein
MVAKPVWKNKWRNLGVNHPDNGASPFPGRNETRWVIVQSNRGRGIICHYEGKPSIQAIELISALKLNMLYFMEFDRKGVFYYQEVYEGRLGEFFVVTPLTWKYYHKDATPTEYIAGFKRI